MSPFDQDPLIETSTVTLERLKIAVYDGVGRFAGDSLQLRETPVEADLIARRLIAEVLASKVIADTQTYEISHPATWWQHLKHSHAPGWFTRRWPVEYETSTLTADFTRYEAYPKANVPMPAQTFGYPVTYDTANTSITSPWKTVQQPGQARKFTNRQKLAYLIASNQVESSGPQSSRPWMPPIRPADALAVLEALAELGVNPDELLREDA